ncbi:Uu.00g078780.m01.CDS01 [Anthostomella pinea]|uniref:Uu.00g078780.m01.CDS01 n=1 Tax=Anthostomella pinea TaxID=933095 RepID=A0AAI8YJ68_9PEZI|nr:Uu.00g078780.m01.CDS01 [Anthostomella pinea]
MTLSPGQISSSFLHTGIGSDSHTYDVFTYWSASAIAGGPVTTIEFESWNAQKTTESLSSTLSTGSPAIPSDTAPPTPSDTQGPTGISSLVSPTDPAATRTPGPTGSPRPSTSLTSTSSPGLSNGAIAGIAVASAVAGGLLGLAIAFLLFRRRKGTGRPVQYTSVEYAGPEKGSPSVSGADPLRLNEFLLDAKPDGEIGAELRSLAHLIQQHVENNYHLQPVSNSDMLIHSLTKLGLDQYPSMTANRLAALAMDPSTRYLAIQHVIATVTFASISMDGISPVSLLPPTVAVFYSMIPPTENYRGSRQAVEVALIRWRQLSAFLLHPHRSDRTPLVPSEDASTQQAQELAVALNTFLGAFAAGDREDRYEQENHLREVIVECVTLGYLLFSQPSEYRFRFDSGGRQNVIVVCPGLEKVSDEDGRRYPSTGHSIVAPMVENI